MIELFVRSSRAALQRRRDGCRRRPRRRPADVSNVDAVEQHGERRRVHRHVLRARHDRLHAETALRQSLVVEDEAVPIPYEDLHPIESAPEKHEEMACEGIEAPRIAHDRDQAIMPATKVDRLRGEVHADARRQGQHRDRSASTNAATYAISVPDSMCTCTPATWIAMPRES